MTHTSTTPHDNLPLLVWSLVSCEQPNYDMHLIVSMHKQASHLLSFSMTSCDDSFIFTFCSYLLFFVCSNFFQIKHILADRGCGAAREAYWMIPAPGPVLGGWALRPAPGVGSGAWLSLRFRVLPLSLSPFVCC